MGAIGNAGIIPILEDMEKQGSEDLREQIEAYQDNFLNVAELSKEAELHQQDLEVIEELEDDIKDLQSKVRCPFGGAVTGRLLGSAAAGVW